MPRDRLQVRAARGRAGLLLAGVLLASPLAAQDPHLRSTIAGALVQPTGQRFVACAWPREPDIIALYYGADWCAPCHAFVPELKRVYAALRAAGADTDVVYVSLDASQRAMHRYMRQQQMPWPAIDHRRLSALPAVRKLGGPAPPNLVLVDRDGRVLAGGWNGRRYSGLQPVLRAWLRHAETPNSAKSPPPAPQALRSRAAGRRCTA